LITNQRARPNRHANIGKPQLHGDLLIWNQLSGDDGAYSGLAEVDTTAGQIFGYSGAERDYIQGHVNRAAGICAPLRLFQRQRWSCTHPTASAGRNTFWSRGWVNDERGAS
jgi:hypothetical protein